MCFTQISFRGRGFQIPGPSVPLVSHLAQVKNRTSFVGEAFEFIQKEFSKDYSKMRQKISQSTAFSRLKLGF